MTRAAARAADLCEQMRALREEVPKLPVVVLSGYAESTPQGELFIAKPFRMQALLDVVQAALRETG